VCFALNAHVAHSHELPNSRQHQQRGVLGRQQQLQFIWRQNPAAAAAAAAAAALDASALLAELCVRCIAVARVPLCFSCFCIAAAVRPIRKTLPSSSSQQLANAACCNRQTSHRCAADLCPVYCNSQSISRVAALTPAPAPSSPPHAPAGAPSG
jgi:hypothetical protein